MLLLYSPPVTPVGVGEGKGVSILFFVSFVDLLYLCFSKNKQDPLTPLLAIESATMDARVSVADVGWHKGSKANLIPVLIARAHSLLCVHGHHGGGDRLERGQ